MKDKMVNVVQVSRAVIVLGVNNKEISVGSIIDKTLPVTDPTTDYSGVFHIEFKPTLAGKQFMIILQLNGLDVDNTAEYLSRPLVVLPTVTTSAIHSNYTILSLSNQTTIQYIDKEETRSYMYTAGDSITILIDSRDEFSNLRYASTSDKYTVKLTGKDVGTVVTGIAK
jgi:hypothetical protein